MDYRLIIRLEAKADLLDAFHWYQQKKKWQYSVMLNEQILSIVRLNEQLKIPLLALRLCESYFE